METKMAGGRESAPRDSGTILQAFDRATGHFRSTPLLNERIGGRIVRALWRVEALDRAICPLFAPLLPQHPGQSCLDPSNVWVCTLMREQVALPGRGRPA